RRKGFGNKRGDVMPPNDCKHYPASRPERNTDKGARSTTVLDESSHLPNEDPEHERSQDPLENHARGIVRFSDRMYDSPAHQPAEEHNPEDAPHDLAGVSHIKASHIQSGRRQPHS